MSIATSDAIFKPRSVALIGASNREFSAGRVTMENLLAAGFEGPIVRVDPKHNSVCGVLAYPSSGRYAFCAGSGGYRDAAFDRAGVDWRTCKAWHQRRRCHHRGLRRRRQRGRRAASARNAGGRAASLVRIVGPNCLGIVSTPVGLNASFAPGQAKRGGIAFVAQSGAMVTTVLDWANTRGIGFSHLVSLGDMADVDFGDMLDYLATDPATNAVLLYIEAITASRKFISAARAAARLKPVIAIKAGRSEAAAKAAHSHTGALAGQDAAYDAALKRAGILRVRDLERTFRRRGDACLSAPSCAGRSVVLTNGGGAGVLATDALSDAGGQLTSLSAAILLGLTRCCRAHGRVQIPSTSSGMRRRSAMPMRWTSCYRRPRRTPFLPSTVPQPLRPVSMPLQRWPTAPRIRRRPFSPTGWARKALQRRVRSFRPRMCRPMTRPVMPCAGSCIWCVIARASSLSPKCRRPSRRILHPMKVERARSSPRRLQEARLGFSRSMRPACSPVTNSHCASGVGVNAGGGQKHCRALRHGSRRQGGFPRYSAQV